MAETIGSLVDKISIMELKIYHMGEQALRHDAGKAHRQACLQKVDILKLQRDDLAVELSGLLKQWSRGTWAPKVYRQFKMYNDPKYHATRTTRATI